MTDVHTVLSFDFENGRFGQPVIHHVKHIKAEKSGYAHFVCIWFELQLLSNHTVFLNTNPEENIPNRMRQTHWAQSCTPISFPGDKRAHQLKQQMGRDEFIHFMSTHSDSDRQTTPKALLLCKGDILELTTRLNLNELRPEPEVNIQWPWIPGARNGC